MSHVQDFSQGHLVTLGFGLLPATECTDSLRWISLGDGGAAEGDMMISILAVEGDGMRGP